MYKTWSSFLIWLGNILLIFSKYPQGQHLNKETFSFFNRFTLSKQTNEEHNWRRTVNMNGCVWVSLGERSLIKIHCSATFPDWVEHLSEIKLALTKFRVTAGPIAHLAPHPITFSLFNPPSHYPVSLGTPLTPLPPKSASAGVLISEPQITLGASRSL